MQRRAFLGAAGGGVAALAGCVEGLFGDDDDETPDGEPTDDGPTPDGTPTDDGGTDTPPGTPTEDEPVLVELRDDQFDPRNLEVDRGATVRWTNADAHEHTVTAASDNWDVDLAIPPEASREHTFEEDGVYDAYCQFHGAPDLSGMAMKIAVGDATIEDPLSDDDYPY